MTDEQDQRRQWFKQYTARMDAGIIEPQRDGSWYTCPCCGYPTLPERGGYDICCLCNWEDDGQDDPHANEIWGGPNGRYSLTEARQNFLRYWVMYHPDSDKRLGGGDAALTLETKKAMAQTFDAMKDADASQQAQLWEIIEGHRLILGDEVRRKVRDYEQRMRAKK